MTSSTGPCAGAAGCLCARRPELLRPDKFYIQVADTRLALRALASAYRDRFAIPFVQVTGSVGKTTTKEMLAAVLGAKLRVLKTPENFNNDIGTPLTLLGLGPEHQAGGDRDRDEPLRGDPLFGGDGAAGHRRHLQHR